MEKIYIEGEFNELIENKTIKEIQKISKNLPGGSTRISFGYETPNNEGEYGFIEVPTTSMNCYLLDEEWTSIINGDVKSLFKYRKWVEWPQAAMVQIRAAVFRTPGSGTLRRILEVEGDTSLLKKVEINDHNHPIYLANQIGIIPYWLWDIEHAEEGGE